MRQDFFFSFLVSFDDGFPGVGGQFHGAAFAELEIVWGELLPVDERDGEAVGQPGAEFFHEVEGEGRAVCPFGVEESDEWIEPCDGECGNAIVSDEGVEEGEEAVDAVAWGAAGAGEKGEFFFLLFEE